MIDRPQNPGEDWLFMGIALSGLGYPQEASAAFEQAIRLDPTLGGP